jgi:hypothetical protein
MQPVSFCMQGESPAPRKVWAEVSAADPHCTIQQTPQWFEAVLRTGGGTDVSRLYTLPDGRRLILPMARRSPFPGLAFDSAYPANYGPGGLLADGGLRPADVRAVLEDLRRSTALSTHLRAGAATAPVWEAGLVPGVQRVPWQTHVVDLTGGSQVVYAERFRSSARRSVRKALRAGVKVDWASGCALVPTFYDLYLRWTERRAAESGIPRSLALALAKRREPLRKVLALMDQAGSDGRVWIASFGDQPVAGMIMFRHGRHATSWRGYSHKPVAGPLRANVLLDHHAIEWACESGCVDYDLGGSGGVRSLEQFKESLGGRSVPTIDLRIERIPLTRMQQMQATVEDLVARQLGRLSGGAAPDRPRGAGTTAAPPATAG